MSPRIDLEAYADEWDDDEDPRGRRRSMSQAAQARIQAHDTGRVVAVDRGRVMLLYANEVVEATYAGSMRGEGVVVGDRVRVRPPRHETDVARVLERLERETVLRRTPDDDVANEERVIAANIDQVVVVIAADHLAAGVGFLDRVLVAATHGGIDPVVCINKDDVAGEDAAAVAERYAAIGYPVMRTSAVTGEGVEELNWHLEGSWTAFAGHSGVGKSSLFNLLVPEAEHEVGEVGPRGGRHTTVASRAYRVPGHDDAWLVDTPGVRSFGLGVIEPQELAACFPELVELACQLDDCLHDGEPGCRVEALVPRRLAPERLAAYRRLLAAARLGEEA